MKGLLAGLTVCLLASLLLMAVMDGVERGYFYRSASLGLAAGGLRDRERAFAATWSGRAPGLRVYAGKAGSEFPLEKWRWRNTHRQAKCARLDSSGRFLRQGSATDFSKYRFSRFCQFQEAMRLPG
jgi:hypothetical protein